MSHRRTKKKSVFGSSQKRIIFVLLCLFTIMFESKQEFIVLFDFNFDLPMLILTSIQMHLNLWPFMGFILNTGSPSLLQALVSIQNVLMCVVHIMCAGLK